MEKPELIFQKKADAAANRIIIPQEFINKWGRNFYMEIYKNQIVLKPMKEGN